MRSSVGQKARGKGWGTRVFSLASVLVFVWLFALPRLVDALKSWMAVNEASAAASLRTVGSANATYSSTYHSGFAGSLAQLGPTSSACDKLSSACAGLLDSSLSPDRGRSVVRRGYIFTYAAPHASPSRDRPNNTFSLVATPKSPKSSGSSTFCVDQTNIVLKDLLGEAKAASVTGCNGFTGAPL